MGIYKENNDEQSLPSKNYHWFIFQVLTWQNHGAIICTFLLSSQRPIKDNKIKLI